MLSLHQAERLAPAQVRQFSARIERTIARWP